MKLSVVRGVAIAVFLGGIAGMIVGSIADNNGIAITFGITTALAALCLVVATSVQHPPTLQFDETTAMRLEERIQTLVSDGADETELRGLVSDSVSLGHSAQEVSAHVDRGQNQGPQPQNGQPADLD